MIEACVDSVDAAVGAERAGAGRVELCADLVEGGATPSAGMIAVTCERLTIPVFVMVRPRGGDFLYSSAERATMMRDIATARQLGAKGIVVGALSPDGSVDVEATRAFVEAARPLAVTFHRAFDLTRDLPKSLDAVVECGVARVLTSGGAQKAVEGIEMLAALAERARDRMSVMAGGGIDARAATMILERTGIRELHVGGARFGESAMRFRRPEISFARAPLPDEYTLATPDDARLRAVVEATRRGLSAPGSEERPRRYRSGSP